MEIEKEIKEQLHIENYSVAERFFSRRNEVYKIHALKGGQPFDFVCKKYIHGDIETESRHLRKLSNLNVPFLLAQSDNTLCLEYIEGPTMLQALEACEARKKSFESHIFAWIGFMQSFYKEMPAYIYGDINLRNFIIRPEGIFAVDLEEVKTGKKQTDFGRAAAFMVTYDPAFTDYKKETARIFLSACAKSFGIQEQDIEIEMQKELNSMEKRRGNRRKP